jgi:hypothetical protein
MKEWKPSLCFDIKCVCFWATVHLTLYWYSVEYPWF